MNRILWKLAQVVQGHGHAMINFEGQEVNGQGH